MRALATWSGAVAGLLLILVGGLIPAYTPFAADGALLIRPLGITLQVPAMLLTALVCGPRSALLATVAYLSVGLFQMPIFTDGGVSQQAINSRKGGPVYALRLEMRL